MRKTINILMGIQEDFFNGKLKIPKAESVVGPINYLIEGGDYTIACLDNYSKDNINFTPSGKNLPVHCIKGTEGAEIHEGINKSGINDFVFKGIRWASIKQSAFEAKDEYGDDLDDMILSRGATEIVIAGLILDMHIIETAAQALEFGYKVKVYKDTVQALKGRAATINRLIEMGVEVI